MQVSQFLDQYQSAVPFFAVKAALEDMIRLILGEPTDQLLAWRDRLLQALQSDARIVAEVVPSIQLIFPPGWLQEQPPVPTIESNDSHLRFCSLISNVFATFASTERPLHFVVGTSILCFLFIL